MGCHEQNGPTWLDPDLKKKSIIHCFFITKHDGFGGPSGSWFLTSSWVHWFMCKRCKKDWKPVVLLCLSASWTQENSYSIGNMNVLKTTKSNRVFHNNENINETCVILTSWCNTLIIHYNNSCFWQSMNTQAWHVSHTKEFAYKPIVF